MPHLCFDEEALWRLPMVAKVCRVSEAQILFYWYVLVRHCKTLKTNEIDRRYLPNLLSGLDVDRALLAFATFDLLEDGGPKCVRLPAASTPWMRPEGERKPVVYFAQQGDHGPIKIGFSTDIENRLKGLQTSSAVPIRMVTCVSGTRDDEADLHVRFAGLRLSGEWFSPAPELLRFISEVSAAGRLP